MSIRLNPALLAQVDEAAADRGLTRSEFIAQVVAAQVAGTGALADPPPRLMDVGATRGRHPAGHARRADPPRILPGTCDHRDARLSPSGLTWRCPCGLISTDERATWRAPA